MKYLEILQPVKVLPMETRASQIDDKDVQVNAILSKTKTGNYLKSMKL